MFQEVTPLKTNMTGWKIPVFNRKYILHSFSIVNIVMLVFGRVTDEWLVHVGPKSSNR